MVTPLDRPLRRAVMIGDTPYVVTIASDGLKLVQKGHQLHKRPSQPLSGRADRYNGGIFVKQKRN
jgi:hypothetical protein